MKSFSLSERVLIKEITQNAQRMRAALKNLNLGLLIRSIRKQLGMSQKALAKRAGVPQSTVSRVEQGKKDVNISTLHKILGAICCDLVMVPVLQDSIDSIRQKQALKVAERHVRYLEGTMSLENQKPDDAFVGELLKMEKEDLLRETGSKLWDE